MKTKYHNVGTIPKSNRKIVETARNVCTGTYNHSLSAIDTEYTDISITDGGVKQDNTRFRCDKPNV